MKLNGELSNKFLFTLKRELQDRFSNSFIGVYWIFIYPLFQTLIYIFIFKYVFQIKFQLGSNTNDYIIYCLSGLLFWFSFSDVVANSCSIFEKKKVFLKNFNAPLIFYPLTISIISLIPKFITILFIIFFKLSSPDFNLIFLFYLFIYTILVFFTLFSVSLFFSIIGVILVDLKYLIPFFIQVSLILTPIFYHISSLPNIMQRLTAYNPFYYIVKPLQNIIVNHIYPSVIEILIFLILNLIIFFFSVIFFNLFKNFIKDII